MKRETTTQKDARIWKLSGVICDFSSFIACHVCKNESDLTRNRSKIAISSGSCLENCSKDHVSCRLQGFAGAKFVSKMYPNNLRFSWKKSQVRPICPVGPVT